MKKALGILASTAAVGAITAALLIPVTKSSYALDYGEYRLAIAAQDCKLEGEAGYDYQAEKCVWWESRAGYCGCFTHDDEPISKELTAQEVEDLKVTHPNWFRDVGVCEGTTGGKWQRWFQVAPYYCSTDADCPDIGTCHPTLHRCLSAGDWSCVLIKRGMPRILVSHAASKGPLTWALEEKCCVNCTNGCVLTSTEWGICPYCLLDGAGACDSLCLPP